MSRYFITFSFDHEGENPKVEVRDRTSVWNEVVLEVFEAPTCTAKEWSWEEEDWKAGPFATQIVDLLNSEEK